jgi:serine protease Do
VRTCLAALACCASLAQAQPTVQAPPQEAPAAMSVGAARIFSQTRDKLLQVRTLTRAARSQSSIGSGFLVADDLAITNYHVVSQKVMQSGQYELQWQSTENQQGSLTVVAVDLANDLALVRLGKPGVSSVGGASTPSEQGSFGKPLTLALREPERGERVYSMGRPLDLGFNVIEGTHNGRVDGDFNQRLLFSGAINSGMSGGPALNARGEVYGINVAKNRNGELVSYVVPVQFARVLLERNSQQRAPQDDFLPVMTEQLKAHQQRLSQVLFSTPLATRLLGRYRVPSEAPPLLRCWANTSRADSKLQHAEDQVSCRVDASVYIDERLQTGTVQIAHRLVSSKELGRVQFQALVAQRHSPAQLGMIRQHLTPDRCKDEFISHNGLVVRATFCTQALKKFPGLYDFGLSITTLDAAQPDAQGLRQSLQSSIHMDGMAWETGMTIARRYLEAISSANSAEGTK